MAHLLPAQTATMNVVGDTAYFVVSVPLSALHGIDDDRSGGASQAEITRHSREIADAFNRRFHVSSEGVAGRVLMTMAWSPQTEGPPADSAYVVVLHSERFSSPPQRLVVETDLFGTRPGEAQMTMTAKRDKREDSAEVAILRPSAQSHAFFKGGLATFADFVRIGIEHILGGPDHLLFLLTIVVAAAGWRYWLGVVTSFTVAHSITLTLAVLGVVRVAPAVVEPGIAASIVLMAALNLWRGGPAGLAGGRARIAVVFACGLLHGLGFAAAIGAIMAQGAHRLATLAGFNLGIELGQFAFVGAVLLLAAVLRRVVTVPPGFALTRIASVIAGVLGMVLLVWRLP
ncbi:HupE/UreJ family protein [Novosphingobium sp.]|uniref:HupE/UreJ family protein n=1 Tax=Novosphingobium sp. TaxID=1874826 RepID=UPI0025F1D0C7|nr:HupE/UreJ family protein [Novosphingobium sp.]